MLIAFPQRHDRERDLLGRPFKERHTLAATEENDEKADSPPHGVLSAKCDGPYIGQGAKNRNELLKTGGRQRLTPELSKRGY